MCVLRRAVWVCSFAVLLPGFVYAQASISGVVRDASGALIPGVTVEAASPALIEKVRTVVTDGAGNYRIVELRPGTYTVTFTLTGFNTVRREGIELSGNFVATVNVELRVGALEETVTVTGSAPVVDTQSARQQQVLSREVVRDIPTSRSYFALAVLVPGMTTSQRDVGGTSLNQAGNYTIHGGRNGDGRVFVDGVTVGQRGSQGDNGGANMTMYQMNAGLMQETAITTSGGLGEAETSGVQINMIPREGGNTVRGSIFGTWGNDAMQGSNYDDHLRELGLRAPNEVLKVWEFAGQIGGPILKDRIWYVLSAKHTGTKNTVAGMYLNKNAGDLTQWTYDPDFDHQAFNDDVLWSTAARLTFQVNAKNKINVFWDEQRRTTNKDGGGSSTGTPTSPDAANIAISWPSRAFNATWNNPLTNRLLLEAGYGGTFLQWGGKGKPGYDNQLIRVVEQAGFFPGLNYRGATWNSQFLFPTELHASASYVTGSHSAKFGFSRKWIYYDDRYNNPNPIQYRFNNGVPNQLTLFDLPRYQLFNIFSGGLYAQDSWVIRRLTLQGGIRFDSSHSVFPQQFVGFTRYNPTGFSIPETEGASLKDISPRMAVSYDLAGDGKTAFKVVLGKYMAVTELGYFGEQLNPTIRIANSTTRSWNDANQNFSPDCDLLAPTANGECGQFSNLNFGKNVYSTSVDDRMLDGWRLRPYNWEFSASVQREIIPRLAVNFAGFRRWFGNHTYIENRAVASNQWDPFTITAPQDSRLPDGGGYTLPTLFDVTPAIFGQTDYFVSSVKTVGQDAIDEHWTGYDLTMTLRQVKGATVSGGMSTGRRSLDSCALKSQFPEFGRLGADPRTAGPGELDPWCNQVEKFQWQYKFLGSYMIPRADVLVSATFQSADGPQLAANFNVPSALAAQTLGRPLAGNQANVTVNLIEPGKLYGERINQLDLRFAKVLNFRGTRTNVGVDLYNALNVNTPTAYNQTYGPRWLTPTAVMPARFVKLSAQLDF